MEPAGRSRAVALPFLLIPLFALPLLSQEPERFSVSGDAVAVYNLAGSVRVEAGTGADVVVEVRRQGDDAAQLKVERREVNGQQALIVHYPEGDVRYDRGGGRSRSTLSVRSDGTFFGSGGGGRRINVSTYGGGTDAYADLRILVPASKSVAVRLGIGDVVAGNITGNLDIQVAAAPVETSRTRGKLRIDTGSGRVTVADAEGDVSIDTGSGTVEVSRVQGGELHVDTGSGGVTGGTIGASDVVVDTGSGHIALTAVASRNVALDTGSGGVELELTTDVDNLTIDTGSGSVRVSVPEGLGAGLDVQTGSGGINFDVPVTVTRSRRNHVVGSIGDGRGTIEIDTGSGSVRINRR